VRPGAVQLEAAQPEVWESRLEAAQLGAWAARLEAAQPEVWGVRPVWADQNRSVPASAPDRELTVGPGVRL